MQLHLFSIGQSGRLTFDEYQQYSRDIRARAERVRRMRLERADRLTASVFGYPVVGTCLHNATLCAVGSGWMTGKTRADLRTVKQANALANCWEPHRIADRAIAKAFQRTLPNVAP